MLQKNQASNSFLERAAELTKKSIYRLYPGMLEDDRKAVAKKFGSGVDHRQVTSEMINRGMVDINSLEMRIREDEYHCRRNGNRVIFPESRVVLDNLLRAKYEMVTAEGFDLPHASFVLAMPNNFACPGTEHQMPALLVSMSTIAEKSAALHAYYQLPKQLTQVSSKDTRLISIVYKHPFDGSHGRSGIELSDLPRLLACSTADELDKTIGLSSNVGSLSSGELDRKIQFTALKLVASVGVYHLATEGKRLFEGFPGNAKPQMMHVTAEQRGDILASTLTNASGVRHEIDSEKDVHYRTWHFRQLRDDRFYKNEFAHLKPGSRYVFVSDAVIGQKVDPSTLV